MTEDNGKDLLSLVDDLANEIMKAQAIEAAIIGLGNDSINDDKRYGVAVFQHEHIERWVGIKDRLDALRTARRRGSLTPRLHCEGELGFAPAGLFLASSLTWSLHHQARFGHETFPELVPPVPPSVKCRETQADDDLASGACLESTCVGTFHGPLQWAPTSWPPLGLEPPCSGPGAERGADAEAGRSVCAAAVDPQHNSFGVRTCHFDS
jgi:hypothetical protein